MSDTSATPKAKSAPEPAPNPVVAAEEGTRFNPDAIFEAAERELEIINKTIERDQQAIVLARARIAAAREKARSTERILAARTPRTRKPKAK